MKTRHLLIFVTTMATCAVQAQDIGASHIHLKGSTTTPTGFTSGAQAKFLWFPSKYAFRAGNWSWNGDPSSGFGSYSLAFGYNAKATANYSVAIGSETIGWVNWYDDPVVFPLQASGQYAVAIGEGAYASGLKSFSMGTVSLATGSHSFAFGSGFFDDEEEEYYGVVASGSNSFAFGYRAGAYNTSAIAFGYQNFAYSTYSAAIGGYVNTASGSYSMALGGYSNYSVGTYSLTAGYNNDAFNPYGGALGFNSQSKAESSFAAGRYLISRSRDAFVVGAYNAAISTVDDDTSATRPLFIVGNGTGTGDRRNALVVFADGVAVADYFAGDGSLLTNLAGGLLHGYNGNVGIGTGTPGARLSVVGAGTGSGLLAQFADSTNTAKVSILDNGRVGIGDSAPSAPLVVRGTGVANKGTVNIRGASPHTGFSSDNGDFKGWVGYYNHSIHGSDIDLNIKTGYPGATNSNIRFGVSGDGAEAMRIASSGNVGIGTTSPSSAKLHIAGSGTYDGMLRLVNTGTGGANFFMGSTNNSWAVGSNKFIMGHGAPTSANAQLSIVSNGNVGIGTTVPLERLQIGNTFAFHDGGNTAIALNTAWVSGAWQNLASGYASFLYFDPSTGNLDISISTGSAAQGVTNPPYTVMAMKADGKVGIGTSTPQVKLDVNGTVRAQELIVLGNMSVEPVGDIPMGAFQ
jgi:hypothetical protein